MPKPTNFTNFSRTDSPIDTTTEGPIFGTGHFFFTPPNDPIKETNSYLGKLILLLTIRGEIEEVKKYISTSWKNLRYLTALNDIEDLAERKFTQISPFQYALWANNWEMWTLMVDCIEEQYKKASILSLAKTCEQADKDIGESLNSRIKQHLALIIEALDRQRIEVASQGVKYTFNSIQTTSDTKITTTIHVIESHFPLTDPLLSINATRLPINSPDNSNIYIRLLPPKERVAPIYSIHQSKKQSNIFMLALSRIGWPNTSNPVNTIDIKPYTHRILKIISEKHYCRPQSLTGALISFVNSNTIWESFREKDEHWRATIAAAKKQLPIAIAQALMHKEPDFWSEMTGFAPKLSIVQIRKAIQSLLYIDKKVDNELARLTRRLECYTTEINMEKNIPYETTRGNLSYIQQYLNLNPENIGCLIKTDELHDPTFHWTMLKNPNRPKINPGKTDTYLHRNFTNISPVQYALWAQNWDLLQVMINSVQNAHDNSPSEQDMDPFNPNFPSVFTQEKAIQIAKILKEQLTQVSCTGINYTITKLKFNKKNTSASRAAYPLDNQITIAVINEKRFNFEGLIAEPLPSDPNFHPEAGKLYLGITDEQIDYALIGLTHEKIVNTIPRAELHCTPPEESLHEADHLAHYAHAIVQLAWERGETYNEPIVSVLKNYKKKDKSTAEQYQQWRTRFYNAIQALPANSVKFISAAQHRWVPNKPRVNKDLRELRKIYNPVEMQKQFDACLNMLDKLISMPIEKTVDKDKSVTP
jgi:hypothetical protein